MTLELIAVSDIATEACQRFLAINPRKVALAGGSTPQKLYGKLAECEFPWSETDVFFGDERCVPRDHEASNFHMSNEALLSKVSAKVHRMDGETCDAEGYELKLRQVFGDELPVFDLVLLGLGEDGHTASLFPGDPALDEKKRWVTRVERPDFRRLTLTLPVLSAAKVAMFLVAGESKRAALRGLVDGEDIPAARVAAERVLILADEAARS